MFLYFIPEFPKNLVNRADMEALGLGYALGVGGPETRKVGAGPDGRGGVVVAVDPECDVPADRRVNSLFEPTKQTWRKGPDGKFYVGFYNGRLPGPKELQRKRLIPGEDVRLRDGNQWTVPIARSVVRGTTLPKELVLDDDGVTWTPQDLPEFLGLCRDAETAFDLFHGGETDADGTVQISIPYEQGMRVAVNALSTNYRLGSTEASLLRLFSDEEMITVLRVVCDLNAYEQVLKARKKNESVSETSPTGAGLPG